MALTDRAYVPNPEQLAALPSLYHSAPRWIPIAGAEDSEFKGFKMVIRANPSNGTIQAISQPGSLWEDVGPFLAPLIKEWNATEEIVTFKEVDAELNEDGTVKKPARRVVDKVDPDVPLPAPSEGDWTVLLKLDPRIREWVLEQCILARLHVLGMNGESDRTDTGAKKQAPSGSTPDGTPDGATTPTPINGNRPARKSSPTR